jgi:aspartyl protease family protein
MNGFQVYHLIWLAAVLVLAVSALQGHRISLGIVVRSLLGWAAIGIVVFIIVQHRHEIRAIFTTGTVWLGIEDPPVQGNIAQAVGDAPDRVG